MAEIDSELKPIWKLTRSDIIHMPDDQFIAYSLVIGPVPPPDDGQKWTTTDAWLRIIGHFESTKWKPDTGPVFLAGEYCRRVLRMSGRYDGHYDSHVLNWRTHDEDA